MRTKLIKITLAASILLAMTFTSSCSILDDKEEDASSSSGIGSNPGSSPSSSPSSNPGSSSSGGNTGSGAFNLNSQVYEINGEYDEEIEEFIYTLAPYTYNGYIEEWNLGRIGTVTNGKTVNVQLPTPGSDLLGVFLGIDEEYISEYCSEDTDADILFYQANYFALYDNGDEYVGPLQIRDESDENAVIYIYFSKAGKISCSFEDGSEYDLNVTTSGWKQVYLKTSFGGYSRIISTDSNILARPVKWILEPYYGD